MPNSKERLTKLFEELGADVDDAINKAEIESYAYGIQLVEDSYTNCLNRVFLPNLNPIEPREYNELMGEYFAGIASYSRLAIATRLAGPWGGFSKTEIDAVMRGISYYLSYKIQDGKMIFNDYDMDDLPKLGALIRGYVPISLSPSINGRHSNFDQWDNWGKKWFFLDKIGFSFDLIEEMEVYKYE